MKRSEGSYTVEVAVLAPLVLAIVVSLIQICFVFHDRVVVREALEYAVLQKTKENIGAVAEDSNCMEIEGRMLISDVTEVSVSEVRGKAEAFACLTSKRIIPVYLKSGESFQKEYTATRKKRYAREKTIVSQIVLDTLHILQ